MSPAPVPGTSELVEGVFQRDFRRIGQAIAKMGLPTVFVQEGGYHLESLEDNARAFFANGEVWQH